MGRGGVGGYWLSLVLLSHAAGFAGYRPLPLTPAAVESALTVPPPEVLRLRSRQLRNPLLRPVELDPRCR